MSGNFVSTGTVAVVLGDCLCPGNPHDQDTAEVREEVTWDVLLDVATLSGGAAYRRLVEGGLVSWNLVDEGGEPVPISEVGNLSSARLGPLAEAVNAAFLRAQASLPNGSGAPSPTSPRGSASPNQTIRPRGRHGKSR